MSRIILTITLNCFLLIPKLKAQDSMWIPSHPILNKVLEAKNAHFTVEHYSNEGILQTSSPLFNTWHNKIIRTPDNTYLAIPGTGLLFKVVQKQGDSVFLKRMDNTVFFGYNFLAISFEYKGDIYSFGGTGFWITNGHLRIFNEVKQEWDIVPVNKEVPAISSAYYVDYQSGKLYYCTRAHYDAVTDNKIDEDVWYVLDLNKKINKKIGPVEDEIKNLIHHEYSTQRFSSYPLPSLNGSLITDYEIFFKFVDFNKMTMYDITDKQLIQSLKAKTFGKIETCFSIDSTIYYLLAGAKALDSTRITSSFYNLKSAKSIIAPGPLSYPYILFYLIPILLSAGIFIYRRKKKTRITEGYAPEEISTLTFDSLEEELLERIKQNRETGITIPEVNDLLGLTQKPVPIQKKNRNEVINKINAKYKLMNNTSEDLITRKRDESDKRSFIYFINEEASIETK